MATNHDKTIRDIQQEVNLAFAGFFGNLQRCISQENTYDVDKYRERVQEMIRDLQLSIRE